MLIRVWYVGNLETPLSGGLYLQFYGKFTFNCGFTKYTIQLIVIFYRSRLAAESPIQQGTVIAFCGKKGHGFIKPDDEEKKIFVHISE